MSHSKQIQEIRDRARQHITDGPVTADYGLDRDRAVAILNEALATELVCVLRYKFHYFMATGIHSQAAKAEFLEHANEEQEHADDLSDLLFAQSEGDSARPLYYKDEVPGGQQQKPAQATPDSNASKEKH